MSEKRRAARHKLRVRCEIAAGATVREGGMVVDLSATGIAVETKLDLVRAQVIEVVLLIPGRDRITLKASVGNHRNQNRRAPARARIYGMRLHQPPAEFLALAEGHGPALEEIPGDEWSVRAKATSGNRMRSVTVDARSEQEALRLARERLGQAWQIQTASRKRKG